MVPPSRTGTPDRFRRPKEGGCGGISLLIAQCCISGLTKIKRYDITTHTIAVSSIHRRFIAARYSDDQIPYDGT
jgi:hypothetical protein